MKYLKYNKRPARIINRGLLHEGFFSSIYTVINSFSFVVQVNIMVLIIDANSIQETFLQDLFTKLGKYLL